LGLHDADDLQGTAVHQPMHTTADRSLRDTELRRDLGEWLSPIVLKLGDNGAVGGI
jgi:hypothetical protein